MSDHIRWGILGAAKFAQNQMAPALHVGRRGCLVALATSSAEKAAPFVEMVPGLRVHDSYEALLADPEIDAVYIPLPNHLHVEWSIKAAEAGKAVLVEKPLAMRADEFDPVIEARDRTGKLIAEAYMIVHHPQWLRTRALVQDGAIGKLERVSTTFTYDNRADVANIRNKPETGGGGLPDIGVYIFGCTRFVTGEEPEEILSTEIRRENGVDVYSHVTARFPSFHYTGIVSMRLAPWQEVTFHGDKGILRLNTPFNTQAFGQAEIELHRVNHGGGGAETIVERFPSPAQYVLQVEAFNAALLDGTDYAVPLEFSRGTQAMIDAVLANENQKAG